MELIIGGDGFLGSHLRKWLPEALVTTRGHAVHHHLDLLNPGEVPQCDIAYFCASINGFQPCQGNVYAYRTNVDGTLAVCRKLLKQGSFVVWISSCAVEWSIGHSYALQKQLVEIALQMQPNCAVVRSGRILPSNVDDLCKTVIKVGHERIEGVTLWGINEPPYGEWVK
jgi:nucleoside-diphosphate-sugar epimerase